MSLDRPTLKYSRYFDDPAEHMAEKAADKINANHAVKTGWILLALTLVMPYLGVAAQVAGFIAAIQGRTTQGILILAIAVPITAISFVVWGLFLSTLGINILQMLTR